MTLEIKAILALALLIGLFAGGFEIYRHGHNAGEALIQGRWDAQALEDERTAAAALKARTDERDSAIAKNEDIDAKYQTLQARAAADGESFAHRLRDAYAARPAGGAVLQSPGNLEAPQALQPRGTERLDGLLGAAASECTLNEDRLDELVAELAPQV